MRPYNIQFDARNAGPLQDDCLYAMNGEQRRTVFNAAEADCKSTASTVIAWTYQLRVGICSPISHPLTSKQLNLGCKSTTFFSILDTIRFIRLIIGTIAHHNTATGTHRTMRNGTVYYLSEGPSDEHWHTWSAHMSSVITNEKYVIYNYLNR